MVGLDERLARTIRKMRPSPGDRPADRRTHHRRPDYRRQGRRACWAIPSRRRCAESHCPRRAQAARPCASTWSGTREPEGPEDRRYRGQADLPLGPAGPRSRRHGLGGRLMTLTGGACFDAVFASDLQPLPCRPPRSPPSDRGLPRAGPNGPWLREIDVGLWEGLTWERGPAALPGRAAPRAKRTSPAPRSPEARASPTCATGWCPPSSGCWRRALTAGHRRVLVVAHKGVNRVILAHFQGLPLGRYLLHRAGLLRGDPAQGRSGRGREPEGHRRRAP